jgi:hypothetical protein
MVEAAAGDDRSVEFRQCRDIAVRAAAERRPSCALETRDVERRLQVGLVEHAAREERVAHDGERVHFARIGAVAGTEAEAHRVPLADERRDIVRAGHEIDVRERPPTTSAPR